MNVEHKGVDGAAFGFTSHEALSAYQDVYRACMPTDAVANDYLADPLDEPRYPWIVRLGILVGASVMLWSAAIFWLYPHLRMLIER